MVNEIRALYTKDTIRVYQAYNEEIANEAVKINTFGTGFKLDRMTWIKPSFLWMMYRCGWATKESQEYRTIQLGLRGNAVRKYVDEWIKNITDITDYVQELREKKEQGEDIRIFLPQEHVYTVR